ncbi:AMP-binding protein [Streptomyces sp. NPDC102274]|uniref:AMP-binding protein n=1 Tax=Streptomyces sp. NPDC102274 TaxID=3366151 RepID=UPI0037F5AA7E
MNGPKDRHTVVDVLDRAALEFSEKKIQFFSPRQTAAPEEITFAQFRDDARALAHHLHAAGVTAGTRAAVMADRNIDFLKAFGALTYCGAVITTLPPAPPAAVPNGHQVHGVLPSGLLDFVVTDERQATLLAETEQVVPHVLVLPAHPGVREDDDPPTAPLPQVPAVGENDLAWIQYTSGSTSAPRGVGLTHRNIVAGLRVAVAGARARPQDIMCHSLPLFHNMGLLFTLSAFECGHDLYISPTDEFFKYPEGWLRKVEECRASLLGGPNAFFTYLTSAIPREEVAAYDLSAVTTVLNGSEPIDPGSVRRFSEHFRPAHLTSTATTPCYGLTEATLAVTCAASDTEMEVDWVDSDSLRPGRRVVTVDPSDDRARPIVNCGPTVPEVEVRVTRRGTPLPDRSVGDIDVRGPSVMASYYGEDTAAVSDEGWLPTGDLGYLSQGCLYVTGRTKEILISAGTNYYPQDVENAVRHLPGVLNENVAAVTLPPEPGANLRERIGVVAETDSPASARRHVVRRIRSAAARRLNGATVDVTLVAPGALLRTPGGKLQRLRIGEMLAAGSLPQVIAHAGASEMIA